MNDRDALLAAILADPADDTVRLAFADWCEENGDHERAEFIRPRLDSRDCPNEARKPRPFSDSFPIPT
jgi:uncharacterized protein (TIGR02996 family)